ncbi:MAG: hypothetical protein Q8R43_00310, partial [Alphaproteobacteria bacterium]|nr:hypothetical protein [Alphaproteobacteria bacterium]
MLRKKKKEEAAEEMRKAHEGHQRIQVLLAEIETAAGEVRSATLNTSYYIPEYYSQCFNEYYRQKNNFKSRADSFGADVCKSAVTKLEDLMRAHLV